MDAARETRLADTDETQSALLQNEAEDAPSATATTATENGPTKNIPDGDEVTEEPVDTGDSKEDSKTSRCRQRMTWLMHLAGVTVPYAAILVGALYRDECPASPNIPVQLIVMGAVTAVLHVSTSIDAWRKLSYLKDNEKPTILTIASLFLFVWMILGCVWVFSIYRPDSGYGESSQSGHGHCHMLVYWFAFGLNVASLVSVIASCLMCCCICSLLCNISILTCLCLSSDTPARLKASLLGRLTGFARQFKKDDDREEKEEV